VPLEEQKLEEAVEEEEEAVAQAPILL